MNSQINSWKIVTQEFELKQNAVQESLFTLANGFIGMRGDGSERISEDFSKPGTFINGFFEKATILYGESAYGFAKNKQIMLNVCNAKLIDIIVDGEVFHPEHSKMESYYRELDMKSGIEMRRILWITETGKKILIENRNLVSMTRKFVAARECCVTPLNFSGGIKIRSYLENRVCKEEKTDDPRVEEGLGDGAFTVVEMNHINHSGKHAMFMKQTTKRSQMSLACMVTESISGEGNAAYKTEDNRLITEYLISGKENETIKLEKYISYVTSQREFENSYEEISKDQVFHVADAGFELLIQEQADYMEQFWGLADVVIKGNEALTQSIRFNLFQLLQSVGRDSATSIPSKGLSGEGYGGHYFWESEAYIAPVFMFSKDDIARKMLEYRYTILDKAREQARLMGHEKGALYSWRSIDGEEASAYFPAGSAQYHINGDIAFAIARYMDATEDLEFLEKCGLEILLETARIWIDMGHYSQLKDRRFCIDCVTGPDEYTALVNNNCYTNLMARENLWNAVKYAKLLKERNGKQYQEIAEKIGLEAWEIEEFQKAGDRMYIPYDENLQIHMQDDSFLQKKILDLKEIPEDHFPLLLHYHPMFIYRHQVCKQPDLLLAQFYLSSRFSEEEKKRDFDYYEKLATHDSSLSVCIFSIMAAETGDGDKAYDYFMKCIRTDLDDMQKNTKDGLHMANMAGAWMTIVHGFAGLRAWEGILSFKPVLPTQMEGYEFSVKYRGQRLKVEADKNKISYEVETGGSLSITHRGEPVELVSGHKISFAW
jgi:trehalose/maltose hydrolase-like predicted phosphorylase